MEIPRFAGLFALIPMTTLLALSFFVLFAALKTESRGLKAFGKFVAVLLWLCAAIFLAAGTKVAVTGKGPFHHRMMMQNCTVDKDGKMVCPMMPGGQNAPVKK